MATAEELARQRDRLATQKLRRTKKRQRFLDRAHKLAVQIRVAGRKIARLDKRIAKARERESKGGLSDAGAKFIARFEGMVLHNYNDAAGHCTIGIGHLVSMAPCSSGDTISEQKAYDLLSSDAKIAANAVTADVKVPLNQAQRDALISFTFNEGTGSLASSTLLKLLNAGNYKAVPSELMRWVTANGQTLPGLVTRRRAEGHLFATGDYS